MEAATCDILTNCINKLSIMHARSITIN